MQFFSIDCQIALGMQSKEIQDSQITASSTYNLHKPFYGRINLASFWGDPARTAWCATKDDKNPYMEIDLKETKSLTGVATQGLSIFDNWVTSFLFCYSENRGAWNCYKERGYDKVCFIFLAILLRQDSIGRLEKLGEPGEVKQ